MREIGSEFWSCQKPTISGNSGKETFLLSGRTALRFIIDDICKNRNFKKVLLPSYCCESMIQPFIAAGIDLQFYNTYSDYLDYPYENDADAVLLIDFFGYINPQNEEIARREKQAGKLIIYDATHKLDGNPDVINYADYSFCSYRKWFYCNCAQAIKYHGVFDRTKLKQNSQYLEIRDKAAKKKEEYLSGKNIKKEEFLSLFSVAEQMLDEDYVGYEGKPIVFDIAEIASKRRQNAAFLIKELKNIPEIKLWRDSIGSSDLPMFVPILVSPDIRNDLRSALIKEHIYCPIHWPKSDYHQKCNELYDMELSLVCDQRYDITDMKRLFQVIKNYFYK